MKQMLKALRSIWIWMVPLLLIFLWLPLLVLVRLFDRDPVHYRTGRWFRRLGAAMVRTNVVWHLRTEGHHIEDPRRPYIVVSNHQSFADIPLISTLPWEMKWLAKQELFSIPFVGWMMKLAGDIPVARGDSRKAAQALIKARWYLERNCSVIFFPEGTRSRDGRVMAFNEGAFHLAVRTDLPILPLAIDGSFDCLPRNTWIFGNPSEIRLAVLEPVEVSGRTTHEAASIVRNRIVERIALWRGIPAHFVDGHRAAKSSDQVA